MRARDHGLAMLAALSVVCSVLVGCDAEGCLDGDDPSCTVPSPCAKLGFRCEGGFARISRLGAGDSGPVGMDALASKGDWLLENDRVRAVVDALDHPHYLAPTGGALLDLATVQGDVDALNHMFQATGLLPGDAVRYTEARAIEEPGLAALQLRGHLDGHPDQRVATRYEVRPCEPGIRVRTEAVNLEPDPAVWTLTDGWYWGGASQLPFAPRGESGFDHPELDIEHATDALRSAPFLASLPPGPGSAAYACVRCDRGALVGFHDEDVSAMGAAPRIVPPRDHEVFERFIAVADADSVAPAVDLALDLRRRLFGEDFTELRGRVVLGDGSIPLGREALATVRVFETRAEDRAERVERTQVTPDQDGRFEVRVPSGHDYDAEGEMFGRTVALVSARVGEAAEDLGEIDVPAPADLGIEVTIDGAPGEALVFVEPHDAETRETVTARRFGHFTECAPWLGPPQGGSPACNRVLVTGSARVAAPPGSYDVYATAGPFATLARREVTLRAGERGDVALAIERLPLQPVGTLSADFHVHGGRSFDSSIPDHDRVRAFLAAGVQVIVASDHDVVGDYAEALDALDAKTRIAVVNGVETTGHVLFEFVPHDHVPKVIGHWNLWPLPFRPDAPWRGAPWDELAEPGVLFTRAEDAGWSKDHGVIQLNHPWESDDFGRDRGFLRAIDLDLTRKLPRDFDGTSQSLFHRKPEGARHRNSDYHAQEVMNGGDAALHLAYRAVWFRLLNAGVVRAGTANSDSHGLSGSPVGSPRTLVWTSTAIDGFDEATFDADVRAGHMLGTNGPVIEVELSDGADARRRPSLRAFSPAPGAELTVRVSAAPWVPVDEIRIVVNGEVARMLKPDLARSTDAFGREDLVRFEGTLPLDPLLKGVRGDAWLVVEAGEALLPAADLDCDGVPDTGDNDGDGVADARDVGVDPDDDRAPARATAPASEDACLDDVGPFPGTRPRSERDDPVHHFAIVVPGARSLAFTNPFLFDRDGGGFDGASR